MLTDAIARNRKREQEKRISHQSLLTDVRTLDWDAFTAKRDLEAGKPCYLHTVMPEIVAALRGEVYNGITESAQYLEMSELANIGGYNFQELKVMHDCRRELAMNFDCPSEQILGVYGAKLGLSSKQMYDKLTANL